MLKHKFVEFMPEVIEEGCLYISGNYSTAIHKCACGCGNEVVTPLSPTDWQLLFDGETISLTPSIGNWSYDCQSHYFIAENRIKWCGQWSKTEIDRGRAKDFEEKQKYYSVDTPSIRAMIMPEKVVKVARPSWYYRIKQFFKNLRF